MLRAGGLTMLRSEQRLVRSQARRQRRAERSVRLWVAGAALTPAVAVIEGSWGWLVVGAGALARAGLWWHQARHPPAGPAPLPFPVTPSPSWMRLRGSAAAEPLRRSEAALAALAAMVRAAPPGPAAEAARAAMASAAQVVDGIRQQASRVLACESAARAVADPSHRAEITGTIRGLVDAMNAAVDALDGVLAAGSDLLASTASIAAPPFGEVAGLQQRTASLRGFAEALRDLRR